MKYYIMIWTVLTSKNCLLRMNDDSFMYTKNNFDLCLQSSCVFLLEILKFFTEQYRITKEYFGLELH
jgi:hypothetical protein